jgi:C4-dicarboxylate-specific signal transduction histidine kinase
VKTADRAIKILRGLRGFGREAAQDPRELASIYEIVDQCVDLQQARFERHRVDLRVELEAGIVELHCRDVQIGQIVTNLLNNAFDAIHQAISPISPERWVLLHAEPLDLGVRIDVSDSGPGIEEKYRAHLLEPFFTTKEHGLGTGIGLSLSRAIAQDHGGSLVLLENTPHTCFRLVLPGDCETGREPGLSITNENGR